MHSITRQHTDGTSGNSYEDETCGGVRPRLSIPTRVPGRDRNAGLQWHKEYTPETKLHSRVLMIDYMRKDATQNGRRVVEAQEIHDIKALKAVYKDGRDLALTLRVFHVQNCTWATKFLIHKFRIRDNDHMIGLQKFGDWLTHKRPQKRAGKPLLVGKSWKTTVDPWRGVAKCSFGLDYMKHYKSNDEESPGSKESRMLGLNGYDSNDNPVHRYDVYSQRLSAYVQYALPEPQTPGPDVISPYQSLGNEYPALNELYDNGHTIIVFDNSETHSIYDTLIPARCEWEIRWRRFPFYITHDEGGEDQVTLECMKVITQDIFTAVAESWDELLDVSWEHVSILEEKIYEQPADESRAPELWLNSANWLKYEKLMFAHVDVVNDMRKYLVDIDGDHSDEGLWLKESPEDFERVSNLVQEYLLKRTNNLSELMYKSVGIRDARQSLQLGTSMWRLSWITFIFLPLTFMVGFFGMNVDTFKGNPSIAWYFIITLPFMLGVLASWYLLKHLFGRRRQSSHERGIYEALYAELQARRPELWSRAGPRTYVQPKTQVSKIKWWFILRWMSPKRFPLPRPTALLVDGEPASQVVEDEPIGVWNRTKRYFVRKWTSDIELVGPTSGPGDAEIGAGLFGRGGGGGDEDGDASEAPTRPSASGLRPSEDADIRLAEGVEGGRNSGVLIEEQVGGVPTNGGMGPQLRVPGDGRG